ncbi:hypothetical protein EIP86_001639 [Pleurotus ostreatoroseus]|nr:hypothetical protein EIP86_001639 [Pleurotus ostreatoroseus]
MVWLSYADATLYSTYSDRGRFALLRWIRRNQEFKDEVYREVWEASYWNWPQTGRVLGGLHTSDTDPDWHFTIEIVTDSVRKIHVHTTQEKVYNSA